MPPMENVPLELRTPQALRERFERVDCDFHKALAEVREDAHQQPLIRKEAI